MPEEGVSSLKHSEVLRYEEIVEIVKAAASMGVSKIRITGGEPLVRPGVVDLVRMIDSINGINDISLTTNGILLADYASELAYAGLKRVNISLDTLNSDKFKKITRNGDIEKVLMGIEAARAAGLSPIKINTVIIRGFNDQEIIPLSQWALQNDLHLRFIEFMPLNDSSLLFDDKYLSSDDIKQAIFSNFSNLKQCRVTGCGPAETWSLDGGKGSLGLIEAVSHSFCGSCNRIRLTADGKLRPCLFSDAEVDLVPILRSGSLSLSADLSAHITDAVRMKPESHGNFQQVNSKSRCMNEIGG